MNTYTIKRMTLQNFCGIRHLEITPDGADAAVYGDNATGKTTIANAFAWLFTGKNAAGTADLDPAPLGEDNAKIHNLETAVSVVLSDGTEFRRVLAEVWSKKRGALTEELTGTKTAYYRDSVPLKEKEFTAAVEELFGSAEQFRMLSTASYFSAAMDWKSRRRALIEMCGDVSDEEVISSRSELSELPDILGNHSVEEYQKIARAKKAEIRKELDLIPARITENRSSDADAPDAKTVPALEAEAGRLEKALSENAERRAKYETSENPLAEKVKAAKAAIEDGRSAFLKDYSAGLEEYNLKLKQLSDLKIEIFAKRSPLLVKAAQLPKRIEDMSRRRGELIAKKTEIKSLRYSGDNKCPCCGQELPPEQIEKAMAEFNRRRSEQLEAITAEAVATCSKELIAAAQKELEDLGAEIARLSSEYEKAERDIAELGPAPGGRFEETEEYARLKKAVDASESEMRSAQPSEAVAALKAEYDGAYGKLQEIRRQLAAFDAAEARRKRIAELEEQQKELAAAYAGCEKGEYLCGQFVRAKVSLLDERINSRFRTLKFKLFHEQQNGGLQEICKVLIPCESGLVEYEKANNAARINAGLEIIDTLSEHYGVRLPVFVDNAESVTALEPVGGQCIRLVVSEADKQLRTEYEE